MALLSDEEIRQALRQLPGWERRGDAIAKQFRLPGKFMGAVAFVNRLAEAAEAADHHPDLEIRWDRVTVVLSTHSQGGITERDLRLAAEAERLA